MKVPKLFRKIDIRRLHILAMILAAVFFLSVFYRYSVQFREYSVFKNAPAGSPQKSEPPSPPAFFTFTPDEDDELGVDGYRLFSFKEKKAAGTEEEIEGSPAPGQTDTSQYQVLGVVKKERLFLVLRLNSDGKIHLYAEGMTIEGGWRLEKVTTRQAILVDSSGGERVHKLFQFDERSIENNAGKQK